MSLTSYYQKLFLDQTFDLAKWARSRFFVKLHRATNLHYDFRLEHRGVLKSWALPVGPCLDPTQPRAAVMVDDHEIRGGFFEGTIPAGQYGAGPVLVWDHGIWMTDDDVDQALRESQLRFQLHGQKLRGCWSLIRKPSQFGVHQEEWLLTKELDAEVRSLSEMDILVEQPLSVFTDQTLAEIEAASAARNARKIKTDKPAPNQKRLSFPMTLNHKSPCRSESHSHSEPTRWR